MFWHPSSSHARAYIWNSNWQVGWQNVYVSVFQNRKEWQNITFQYLNRRCKILYRSLCRRISSVLYTMCTKIWRPHYVTSQKKFWHPRFVTLQRKHLQPHFMTLQPIFHTHTVCHYKRKVTPTLCDFTTEILTLILCDFTTKYRITNFSFLTRIDENKNNFGLPQLVTFTKKLWVWGGYD